jgi:hypothetical protein
MHLSRTWLATLAALAGCAGLASAQCDTWPIPRAPDMCGPGYYQFNCNGFLYGPYHNVYPWFGPHQGFVPGPKGGGGGGAPGAAAGYEQMYQKYKMQPGYVAMQQHQQRQYMQMLAMYRPDLYQQIMAQQPGGFPGFFAHPAIRSPRDYFMYSDDPLASPYRYGGVGGAALPSMTDRMSPDAR